MNEVAKMGRQEVAHAADPMVSMIERVAMSPDLPIERLERMMDLKDRHDANIRRDREEDARRLYNAAMAKAQSAMPTVVKSKKNDHTRSTYADLSDIEEQAMPIAYANGFSVSFTPGGTNEKGELLIDWCLMHEGGHTREGTAGFPLDATGSQGKANKTGIQAMGSTMTYARRYLLCNLFNIATDDDTDGNAPPAPAPATITEAQLSELQILIAEAQITEAVVCEAERLSALSEMPVTKFRDVAAKLRNTIANKKGAR